MWILCRRDRMDRHGHPPWKDTPIVVERMAPVRQCRGLSRVEALHPDDVQFSLQR